MFNKPCHLPFQRDLSDLDLETLAPYIPMDGEDFQLNPIIPESEPLDGGPAGSLPQSHHTPRQSFSNIASLFQPLSSPPQPQGPVSWGAAGEKRGSDPRPMDPRAGSYMMGSVQNPPYQAPASTPLSSLGGRKNLQWPPDPLLTYQQLPPPPQRGSKAYLRNTGEERPSCQQSTTHSMHKQR